MYFIGLGFNILNLIFIIVMSILNISNHRAIYDFFTSIIKNGASEIIAQYESMLFYIMSYLLYGILLAIILFHFRWFKVEDKTVISNIIVIVSIVVVFILSIIFTGFLPMLIIGPFYLFGAIFCLIAF